mgnify:CR=1 FL=1
METLSLDGTWKLRWADGQRSKLPDHELEQVDESRYIDAAVPGEVHLDLLKAGMIDDPYVGTNVLKCRWVEECYWSYRRTFDAPDHLFAPNSQLATRNFRAWLVFDGLDYAATIVLNGQVVGRHSNVFHPCRIDVTGRLRPGSNLLVVHLESGLFGVSDKPGSGYGFADGYEQLLHKRHWLRKPQFQFSWDWSQRLVNVGIFGGVRLEWTDAPARLDQLVPLVTLSEDLKTGTVRVRQFVEAFADTPAELTVEMPELGLRRSVPVDLRVGLHPCELTFTVAHPKLWWPVGHGQQNLYTLRATLSVEGRAIGSIEKHIGFRHVRINQDPHPDGGKYFVIEVNGRKIFAKGGNFVPADMILARLDRDRYDRLTDLALEANFNLLRVWGGGLYESADFYELCDRKGILVWQEFIFACSRYPIHDLAFFENVKAEATWNIRRLASHPSLVIWCGNNELEWGAWDWNYSRDGTVLPDHALFHITLPRILAEEDPTRFYWPSSPYSPDHQHPNASHFGDQHPWGVSFGTADYREYRNYACRFPNEGGYLGPTSLPTMLACLPEEKDRRIGSLAWEVHDNTLAIRERPMHTRGLSDLLGMNERSMSLQDFAYWAGLLQGEALREYCDNFRRRMFDSAGAIFWMYNDCWPCTRSWTIVDYDLHRTPAFHPVRRAMAPLSIVVALTGAADEQVTVFGINDTSRPLSGELRYGLFDLAGGYPLDRTARVTLAPDASTPLARFPRSRWKQPRHTAAFAVLSDGGRVLARNRLFLPAWKDLCWAAPQVSVEFDGGKARFVSPTFAWGVCLDLDGRTAASDNFFDLYPGMPHEVAWPSPTPPQVLRVGNLVP